MSLPFYAQFEEDKILHQYFKQTNGTCVEVGAFDGTTYSNTLFFEKQGWTSILVEPNPSLCKMIKSNRNAKLFEGAAGSNPGKMTLTIAKGVEELSALNPTEKQLERIAIEKGVLDYVDVQVETLNNILNQFEVQKIDFITIDVEGHEIEVLKSFDIGKFRPGFCLVEDSLNRQVNDVYLYLLKSGYLNFKRTGCNDWFRHYSTLELQDLSSVAMLAFYRVYSSFLYIFKPLFLKLKAKFPGVAAKLKAFFLKSDNT